MNDEYSLIGLFCEMSGLEQSRPGCVNAMRSWPLAAARSVLAGVAEWHASALKLRAQTQTMTIE